MHNSNNDKISKTGIHLTTELSDFYSENYKTLMKETEEDTEQ